MIRRVLTAAFAASLALPAGAAAQFGPGAFDPPSASYRITPFLGYLTGFVRHEEWTVQDGSGGVTAMDADVDIAGGPGAGIQFEAPVRGNFGATAALGVFGRGETLVTVIHSGDRRRVAGANVLLARLGVAYHMPTEESEFVLRRLGASAFAGGVVMHDRLRNTHGDRDMLGDATHFGVNLGVNAELPFAADRYAVQLGIEDNIMFWRGTQLASLPHAYAGTPGTPRDHARVTAGTSHSWLFRAGLSIRIR
jgi:hypothetical protein